MKHKIDPTVDCVFKAILGSEENKNLLIHFLNAVLEPAQDARISTVELKNPYNAREFSEDKLTVVDVKATDEKGHYYQIEIQLAAHAALAPRMLYTWSSIYHAQIKKGDYFPKLKPVIAIWIMGENLFEEPDDYYFAFSLYDKVHELVLTDHLSIHLLQLPKWHSAEVTTDKERWVYLFKEGKNMDADNIPAALATREMKQALGVMERFSENEWDYLLYQSRLEADLERNTYLYMLEEERKEKEQVVRAYEHEKLEKEQKIQEKELERLEKERERLEKEQAQQQLNTLLLRLKEKGISPDALEE